MKKTFESIVSIAALAQLCWVSAQAEPLLSSWYTERAGSYARIWESLADETTEKTTGTVTSVSTWDADTITGNPVIGTQALPIYGGVQGISYSDDYVYIKATGLALHTMGPWYDNTDKTQAFPSFPANAAILYRFPRDTSDYTETYTSPQNTSGLGTNGLSVDGIPIFNSSDGASYNDAGVWNQDAFFNEGTTFDSGNAHQAAEAYHYHANPAGLRNLLGDSVDYDSTVVFTGLSADNPYTESPNGEHSPIIGWIIDGLPIYGPYGYSDPTDHNSTVRRMISGYQMRDGTNGSYDLETNGRDLLPDWSVNLGIAASTTPGSDGPTVDETGQYRLGSYIEDYAYKGDLVGLDRYQGVTIDGTYDSNTDYDLNEYNVRYCVTPEFPNGTWAYFTCIQADGTPIYPYNVSNTYFGDSSLAAGVETIDETVTEYFEGAASIEASATDVANESDSIVITWSGIEGGIYRVDTTEDLEAAWVETATTFTSSAADIETEDTDILLDENQRFYRLTLTEIASYDTTEFSTAVAGGPGGGGPGGDGPGGGGPP